MDKHTIIQLNNNPTAKLAYLKTLLYNKNITLEQQNRIYHLIQKTEIIIQKEKGISMVNQGTQNLNNENRIIETQNIINDMDKYKNQYNIETAKKREEFENDIKLRREKFMNDQRKRRIEYENALSNFENEFTNALQIFKISSNYTLSELKKAYKKIAVNIHPDKPDGNKEQFQYITKCYMLLVEKLKKRDSNEKTYADLKKKYNNNNNYDNKKFKKSSINGQLSPDNKNFNTKLFNKLYEDNRLWNPNDDGYGDMMSNNINNENNNENSKIFDDKFCLNVFNSTFDKLNTNNNDNDNKIIEYNQPRELIPTENNFSRLEGDKKIDDFSKSADSIGGLNGLTYTDYKKAYENNGSNLLYTNVKSNRPSYNSVDDLERERSKVSHIMNEDEQRQYNIMKQKKEEEEIKRQNRLHENDMIYQNHYDNTHEKLLGFTDTNDDNIDRLTLNNKNLNNQFITSENNNMPSIQFMPPPQNTQKSNSYMKQLERNSMERIKY